MTACLRKTAVRWVLAVTTAIWVLYATGESPARADGRVQFLADRLRFPPAAGQADDFRVRTNAALALAATKSDDAIAPLCAGLDDPSDVVRQAVAVALKRLAKSSSTGCLKQRASVEASTAVRQEIDKALQAVDAAGSGGSTAPAPVANARFYVSLSRVTNHTTREGGDVERIVRGAVSSKLGEVGGYELAPASESADAAKAALSKRRLKGYYLAISVDKFDYSDAGLRVRVKIAVFSYPGKDLRGEIPAGATLPGAHPGDKGSEDQLMSVVAARAAELFAQNFQ
jgi:HEAT repeats